MSHEAKQRQDENTAKLVMSTFDKVASDYGTTAEEITRYLQDKFGDVWKMSSLTGKAEETLKQSAALGFLERYGDRYIAKVARQTGCSRRRTCRRKRRSSCRRRRKRGGCGLRRRRRKRSCCCGKTK